MSGKFFLFSVIAAGISVGLDAQNVEPTGAIQGTVRDSSGGTMNKAVITAIGSHSNQKSVESKNGEYAVPGLEPGRYEITAAFPGFEQKTGVSVLVLAGKSVEAELILIPAAQNANVTVTDTVPNQLSVDPARNADSLVLNERDIEMLLPEDPDDLVADLTALAGPSAGLSGDQIFVDGFITGRMPPKESIREIRINANPFSAEFDKIGFGRIQIFTKPGSDRFHGTARVSVGNHIWNTRTAFIDKNPPYYANSYAANLSGPIAKKASFFFDFEHRDLQNYSVIIADVVPSIPYGLGAPYAGKQPYTGISDQSAYLTPQRRDNVSPRFDIALNPHNTLSARYAFLGVDFIINGPGGFSLGSQAFLNPTDEHTVQITDTAVLNTHVVNEARFQFDRLKTTEDATSNTPQINVANSFTAGGGSGFGHSWDVANNYEFRDYVSVASGRHAVKFGVRWNTTATEDFSQLLFDGMYNFLGGLAAQIGPDNLPVPGPVGGFAQQHYSATDIYATTQRLLDQGVPYPTLRKWGYGPTQYLVNRGNPFLSFTQMDFGAFVMDEFRVRPNLTVSLGARWEGQTNIHDQKDIGPRVAIAWAPNSRSGAPAPRTVFRGGWGIFYDRFFAPSVLNAYRYNGNERTGQLSYIVRDTSSYPDPPSAAVVSQADANITYLLDNKLHAAYLMQTAFSAERQLARRTNFTVNFTNTRGVREYRVRDINAPLPGTFTFRQTAENRTAEVVGQRPYPGQGHLYNFESTGTFRQTQLIFAVNSAIGASANLFVRYTYAFAKADTDGLFTFPANQYDFSGEYARSALDVRHNFYLGGYISVPLGIQLAPTVTLHSGPPFSAITGTDLYQVGTPTSRPGIAAGPGPGIIFTRFGYFDPIPKPGEPIAARNGYEGPGYIGINLRISRTWGFGTKKFQGPSGGARSEGPSTNNTNPGGPGFRTTEHRFNLILVASIRDILNHENLNSPIGALTSPYFGQGLGTTGAYTTENTATEQRRSDIQLRFTF